MLKSQLLTKYPPIAHQTQTEFFWADWYSEDSSVSAGFDNWNQRYNFLFFLVRQLLFRRAAKKDGGLGKMVSKALPANTQDKCPAKTVKLRRSGVVIGHP
jgi:hypothetical protein